LKVAISDFGQLQPDWPFAFKFDENMPFIDYVSLVDAWSNGKRLNGFVPNTFLVAEVNGIIVGRVSIRHQLNDFLLYEEGGHIGYGVVPSQRKRGYATQILRSSLPIAKKLGLSRVLLTTDKSNLGSIRAVEKNGGILETSRDPRVLSDKLRYWIKL